MAKEKEVTVADLLEKDLLKNINAEIKKLESKKASLDSEIGQKQEALDHYKSEIEKEIEAKRSELSIKIQEENQKIDIRHKELDAREKDIKTREKEVAEIREAHKKLEEARISFKEDIDLTDKAKAMYLEKEHKAQLLIEQYTKKLEELEALKN